VLACLLCRTVCGLVGWLVGWLVLDGGEGRGEHRLADSLAECVWPTHRLIKASNPIQPVFHTLTRHPTKSKHSRSIVGVEERTAKATAANPHPATQINLLIFDPYTIGEGLFEATRAQQVRCVWVWVG
jgi:hypothetical protein